MFNLEETQKQKEIIVSACKNVGDAITDFGEALTEVTKRIDSAQANGDGIEFGLTIGMAMGGVTTLRNKLRSFYCTVAQRVCSPKPRIFRAAL